jgi:hypothetical protein
MTSSSSQSQAEVPAPAVSSKAMGTETGSAEGHTDMSGASFKQAFQKGIEDRGRNT